MLEGPGHTLTTTVEELVKREEMMVVKERLVRRGETMSKGAVGKGVAKREV